MMQLDVHQVQSIEIKPIQRLGSEGSEFSTRELLITDINGNTVKVVMFANADDVLRIGL